jgi:hypothetical protein
MQPARSKIYFTWFSTELHHDREKVPESILPLEYSGKFLLVLKNGDKFI